MGDFLLDIRPAALRQGSTLHAARDLKFCADTEVQIFERDAFGLVIATTDDMAVWGPFETEADAGGRRILVAVAGRVALEPTQWPSTMAPTGRGGTVCRGICALYSRQGISGLTALSGHFVIIVHDEARHRIHLVTDRFGACLAYRFVESSWPIFSSHPDVLAGVVGQDNWDRTSLAEFVLTGRLSFPHTYHNGIKAQSAGTLLAVALAGGAAVPRTSVDSYTLEHRIDAKATERDLSDMLAVALREAVERRIRPEYGLTGVSLSGGLDSRAILAGLRGSPGTRTSFTLYDEENFELQTARAVAQACAVESIQLQRTAEYYGDWAEQGVRIAGGTGCASSNHYLGVREQLRAHGIQNLLTGCYCDYLFKGLALNTRTTRLLRLQRLAGFGWDHYLPCYWPDSPTAEAVRARLRERFPQPQHRRLGTEDWLAIERARIFPIAYEADCAMRMVAQRTLPWNPPFIDNAILDVYLRIPPHFKLNSSLFRGAMKQLCDARLMRIPDSNTGVRVNGGMLVRALGRYRQAVRKRIAPLSPARLATRGSWPNWGYYYRGSPVVLRQWQRANPAASAVFREILGEDPLAKSPIALANAHLTLFGRLWTQKLWLDQQCGVHRSRG